MTQNDSSDIIERWRSGVEFSVAWHKFANPYQRQSFSNAATPGAQVAHQILMVADLWAALRDGELMAYGKCVTPEISNGPVLIPVHMFEFAPPRGIEDSNDIEISGWRYEGVKVARADQAVPDREPPPEVQPIPAKRGGGRRDTYVFVAKVLRQLFEIEGYQSLSPEDLHLHFKPLFERMFPTSEYNLPTPSPRTLRTKIGRYWKELAETGNI